MGIASSEALYNEEKGKAAMTNTPNDPNAPHRPPHKRRDDEMPEPNVQVGMERQPHDGDDDDQGGGD